MNITDIQLELRKISSQLEGLENELENLKPKKDSIINKESYKDIEKMAEKYPIENNLLKNSDELVKKKYIQFLSMAANINKENMLNKLTYIYRIVVGAMLIEYDVEDIVMAGIDVNNDVFYEIAEMTENVKYTMLTDALVVVGMSENIEKDELSFVADMAKIMNCDNDDMKVISTMARCMLVNNFDGLDKLDINTNKWVGVFTSRIPRNWLNKRWKLMVKSYKGYSTSSNNNFNLLLKNDEVAKIGDKLAKEVNIIPNVLSIMQGRSDDNDTINADINGIVFIEEKGSCEYLYIMNFFDDFSDFRKNIVKYNGVVI